MTGSSIVLEREPSAMSVARRWLQAEVGQRSDLEPERLEQILVMASELVANVIVHTTSSARLVLRVDPRWIRVEVRDDDPRLPSVQPVEPLRAGGNGLLIVAALASDWGAERDGVGKVVWFVADR